MIKDDSAFLHIRGDEHGEKVLHVSSRSGTNKARKEKGTAGHGTTAVSTHALFHGIRGAQDR